MTDGVRRRDVLAAIGGVGAVGALSGAGTAAVFREVEALTGTATAGAVGLHVECPDGCVTENGDVSLDLSELPPDTCGDATLCAVVESNPAWLWLRAACPPDSAVLDAVYLRVRYADGTVVEDAMGVPLTGTAGDVLARLTTGVRLDPTDSTTPVEPGESVCLTVEWGVADVGSAGVSTSCSTDLGEADGEVSFGFEFGAVQQRHTDPPTAPWDATLDCDPRTGGCVGCNRLGKVDDVDGDLVVGEEYAVAGTNYAVLVDDMETKEEGEVVALRKFRLIEAGSADDPVLGPRVCLVDVKGGPGHTAHEVCPPTASPTGEFDAPKLNNGNRPGISHITVYTCGSPPQCW